MPEVDQGEELTDSNYLPHKNTRGRIKIQPSARVPHQLPKSIMGKAKERADADKNANSESSKGEEERRKGIQVPVSLFSSISKTDADTRQRREEAERLLSELEIIEADVASRGPKTKKCTPPSHSLIRCCTDRGMNLKK